MRCDLLLFSTIYGASNFASAYTIACVGSYECSVFNAVIERDSAAAIDSFISWGQGFIGIFNASQSLPSDIAIARAGRFLWLAHYCGVQVNTSLEEALPEMIGRHSH